MRDLLLGISLGWAAGVSPGPLMALVVTTSLQRGFGAGARVAVAPLLTDAPIVTLSVVVASTLPETVIRVLSYAGAAYLVGLGISELRGAARASIGAETAASVRDVRRGFFTNLLSPHPWLFWLTVGGPILVAAWERAPIDGIGFVAGFFGLLVGTKLVIAAVVDRVRRRLRPTWYRWLVAAGGFALVALGLVLAVGA